jgi:hypothetical protein
MNTLKLIVASAIIIGLTQLELDGGPQRKYYTGSKVIQARQDAAAAGTLPATGTCSGGSCPFQPRTQPSQQDEAQSSQQAEKDALQAQIDEQKKQMEEQARKLAELEEKLNNMNK